MAKPKPTENENPNIGQPAQQPGATDPVPTVTTGTSDPNDTNAAVPPADTAGELTPTGATDQSPVADGTGEPTGCDQGSASPEEEPDQVVNPNTGENDESRLVRGAEGEPIATEPVEDEPVAPTGLMDLNFDSVKGDINTVQKICDVHAVELKLNLYENTAKVLIPDGSTFSTEALAAYL